MRKDKYQYTQEDVINVAKEIEKRLLKNYKPTKNKKAVFIGGQPGAGKSVMSRKVNKNREYLPVDIDSYRKFHPMIDQILENDLWNYTEMTGHFAYNVKIQIIEDFTKEGYCIMMDETLRNADKQIAMAEKLIDRGYSVEIKAMCVKKEIAYMSTVLRKESTLKDWNEGDRNEVPRIVKKEFIDSVAEKELPESLNSLQKAMYKGKKMFENIQLYNRDAECLLDTNQKNVPSGDALKRRNQKPYNKNEFKQLQSTVKETCKLKLLNNSSDIEEFTKESNNIVKSVGKKMSKGLSR